MTDHAVDDGQRAEIERACTRLVVAYSHLIDFGRAGEVGDLFTEDGIWESPEARLTGREQIAAAFARRQANQGRRSRHVCTNLAVDVVSPSEASGVCYFTLYRADGVAADAPARVGSPEMVGDYHDTFVLTSHGWRIAHRRASVSFTFAPLGADT